MCVYIYIIIIYIYIFIFRRNHKCQNCCHWFPRLWSSGEEGHALVASAESADAEDSEFPSKASGWKEGPFWSLAFPEWYTSYHQFHRRNGNMWELISTSRSCEQTNCWIWWINVLWYAYHVSGMYQQARAFACWPWLRSWVDCRVTVTRWLFEDGKTCISIIFHVVHLL